MYEGDRQQDVNDFVYLFAFALGLWNTHRTFLAWDPAKKFPYRLLTVICVQLFLSLIFVVVPVMLTYFITPVQAFSWLFFVIVHAGYCWKVYKLTERHMHSSAAGAPGAVEAATAAAAAEGPRAGPAVVAAEAAPVSSAATTARAVPFASQPPPKSAAHRAV